MFEDIKKEIIKTGMKMDRYGLISLAGGKVSVRTETGELLVTPSGMIYEEMVPDDVLVMDAEGNIIEGTRKPSSDTPAILYIFKNRPDVNCVIHTHQPYATAISLIDDEFRADLTTLGNACGGNIPVAPYSSPGSEDMGKDTVKYLGDGHCVILAHHGVMATGDSIHQALNAVVYLKDCAKGYLAARACGPTKHLTDAQIRQTVEIYKFVGQDSGKLPEELTKREGI